MTEEKIKDVAKKREAIERLKKEITKAEGAKEEIMKRLATEFDIHSDVELSARIKTLEEKIKEGDAESITYMERLDSIIDWDSV